MNRRREGGLTLVELLVTLTVTVIGLTALLGMHVGLVRSNAGSQHVSEATAVAETTIEELRGLSAARLQAHHGPLPVDVTLAPVPGRSGVQYTPRVRVEALAAEPDLLRVDVEVGWTERGAEPGGAHDRRLRFQVLRTAAEAL